MKRKRILVLILAFLLVLSVMPAKVSADETGSSETVQSEDLPGEQQDESEISDENTDIDGSLETDPKPETEPAKDSAEESVQMPADGETDTDMPADDESGKVKEPERSEEPGKSEEPEKTGGQENSAETEKAGKAEKSDESEKTRDQENSGESEKAGDEKKGTDPEGDADRKTDADADAVLDPAEDREKTDNGIPVINLTIDPDAFAAVISSPDHSYAAENCSIRIDVPEGYTCEYGAIDPATVGTDLALEYFRGRGNSTWNEAKKPFKIKLADSADLLAMGKNAHWVLLASAHDGSMMRNRLVSYLGIQLGLAYTPKFVSVDLVVNGEYYGCYLLGTHVRIDENRIDIDKVKKSHTTEPEITGGYLIGMEPYPNDPDVNKFDTEKGEHFAVDTPDFSEYNASQQAALNAQKNYISDYMQRVEDAVWGEDFKNSSGEKISDLMDLPSAAKYWWIQEFTCNDDAFVTPSTYLYKVRNGKLYWGPVWDFDHAFWPVGKNGSLTFTRMTWLDILRSDNEEYQQLLRQTWNSMNVLLQEAARDGGVLDRYKEEIARAWEKDREVWGGTDQSQSLEELTNSLKSAVELRRQGINEKIGTELTKVFAHVTFTDGENVLAKERCYIGGYLEDDQFPEAPGKEGYFFLNWADEDGEAVESYMSLFADKTVHPEYVAEEDATRAEAIYFKRYEIWCALEDGGFYPEYTVTPEDAYDKTVEWSFSDPSLVRVDDNGMIVFNSAGDVTVTGTTENGKTASFILHIRENMEMQEITKIIPEKESLTLHPDEYGQVRITFEPEDCFYDMDLGFESDDEDIASVDENGVVHARKSGTAVITVTDYVSGKSAAYTVNVEEKEPDWKFTGFEWTGNEKNGYTAASACYRDNNDTEKTEKVKAVVVKIVSNPTCTEDRKTVYTATVSEKDSLDGIKHEESKEAQKIAAGHNLILIRAKEPTKTKEGNLAYYMCTLCGKWFRDAEGKEEITDKSEVIIPAKGSTSEKVYEFVSGENSEWTRGSGETLRFVLRYPADDSTTFSHFVGVRINGKRVREISTKGVTNYVASPGSLILEFMPEYLQTKAEGVYTLTFLFDDGTAPDTVFTVKAASGEEQEKNGQNGNGQNGNGKNGNGQNQKGKGSDANTGDSRSVILWAALLVLSAGGVIICRRKYRIH